MLIKFKTTVVFVTDDLTSSSYIFQNNDSFFVKYVTFEESLDFFADSRYSVDFNSIFKVTSYSLDDRIFVKPELYKIYKIHFNKEKKNQISVIILDSKKVTDAYLKRVRYLFSLAKIVLVQNEVNFSIINKYFNFRYIDGFVDSREVDFNNFFSKINVYINSFFDSILNFDSFKDSLLNYEIKYSKLMEYVNAYHVNEFYILNNECSFLLISESGSYYLLSFYTKDDLLSLEESAELNDEIETILFNVKNRKIVCSYQLRDLLSDEFFSPSSYIFKINLLSKKDEIFFSFDEIKLKKNYF